MATFLQKRIIYCKMQTLWQFIDACVWQTYLTTTFETNAFTKIDAIQEKITHTWVSPHFTFDIDNYNVIIM